jgi:hypothetical protein
MRAATSGIHAHACARPTSVVAITLEPGSLSLITAVCKDSTKQFNGTACTSTRENQAHNSFGISDMHNMRGSVFMFVTALTALLTKQQNPSNPFPNTAPGCNTQPTAVPNAVAFACALPAVNGTACSSSCLSGFTGAPSATCLSSGAWSVTGTCIADGGTATGECQVGLPRVSYKFAAEQQRRWLCPTGCDASRTSPDNAGPRAHARPCVTCPPAKFPDDTLTLSPYPLPICCALDKMTKTGCTTQPAVVPNAVAFACALPAANGMTCTSSCLSGFTGAPSATCLSSGAWSVTGTCIAGGGGKSECQVSGWAAWTATLFSGGRQSSRRPPCKQHERGGGDHTTHVCPTAAPCCRNTFQPPHG